MSSSFRSILQQVTQEKLEELKLQKNLMTAHFHPILEQLEKDPAKKGKQGLSLLYEGLKSIPVKDTIDFVLIENLKYVLQNSEQDPSISDQLIHAWTERVKGEIRYALRKCEYSYLYGSLLSEWLEVEEKRRKKGEVEKAPKEEDMEVEGQIGSGDEAKAKVTSTLKQLMFTAPTAAEFQPETFRKFLSQELFSFGENVEGEQAFLRVIKETVDFFRPENYYISTHDVKCCIQGLTSDELLSQEKKAALKELSANQEALEEVATLLTNRLKNLDRWNWPANIEQDKTEIRRGLAGEYKAFLNEDIITALFLQYVGVEWAAYFKRQFLSLYDSRAWVKKDFRPNSIEGYRREFHRMAFLSALPDSIESQENKNKEEYARVEAECVQAMSYEPPQAMFQDFGAQQEYSGGAGRGGGRGRMLMSTNEMPVARKMRAVCPPPPSRVTKPPTDIDFKQQFLHVLNTEIKLNQVLRPEQPLLVVQADLDSFGPSVIHDATLIALEFLGVSKQWLSFFKKFLQPQIKFADGEKPQKVVRGVPSAHVLGNFFGETLLFLLDFLVNRKCKGMRIYRVSDELWFWSHESDHVGKAWETLQTYGQMVGLKVNENRSGSVAVLSEGELLKRFKGAEVVPLVCGPSPLPQKSIHWGYLQLQSNGVFQIDQKAVTKFLDEMKGLLEKSECVLEWINIFNKYFTFFIRNFGKSAVTSGKQHLDQIVSALNTIYSGLSTTDPVNFLKLRFLKLREADIVDAWVYWPLERGGLGLVNPFIGVMAMRETFSEDEKNNAERDFAKLPHQDKISWEEMKKEHERLYGVQGIEAPVQMSRAQFQGPRPPTTPKLPTWEEYVASRETDLNHWWYRYEHLLSRPGPKYPPVSEQFHTMGWKPEDEIERVYFMWLFSYYETQLKGHFGDVTFINSKLLPMSMIANIQKTKVQHN